MPLLLPVTQYPMPRGPRRRCLRRGASACGRADSRFSGRGAALAARRMTRSSSSCIALVPGRHQAKGTPVRAHRIAVEPTRRQRPRARALCLPGRR
jgi:hypothetical protein